MVSNTKNPQRKKSRGQRPPTVAAMVESCVGCKWTLHVLGQIRKGVRRPGALVRSADGLTTKVLNERLRKLMRFGVLRRRSFPQIPPRVEYSLSPFGRRFIRVLDEIERLQDDMTTVEAVESEHDRA